MCDPTVDDDALAGDLGDEVTGQKPGEVDPFPWLVEPPRRYCRYEFRPDFPPRPVTTPERQPCEDVVRETRMLLTR